MMFLLVTLVSLVCFSSGLPFVTVAPHNVVTVPTNCPPGQEYVNGICRDVWRRNSGQDQSSLTEQDIIDFIKAIGAHFVQQEVKSGIGADISNVISVPNQCPVGYKPDALGICRQVW